MQDMATMQQHSITSPAPANTIPSAQDSSIDCMSNANCDREMHHETSRTDAENCDEVPREREEEEEEGAVEPKREPVEQEDEAGMRYVCPICEAILLSQHDFTLHIRSHNNDAGDGTTTPPSSSSAAKGYACRICGKVLSSSSSLDRHVLVHSGERPFKCSVCGVAFTTNGNMHRHMRKHGAATPGRPENYESDGSTDSGGSLNLYRKSPPASSTLPKKRKVSLPEVLSPGSDAGGKRKAASEFLDVCDGDRRRVKGGSTSSMDSGQRLQCPVCDRDEFGSVQGLEAHLEAAHPEYGGSGTGIVRCGMCDAPFKTQRELSLHHFMAHREASSPAASPATKSVLGFKDLTFVDFSSEKFPHIARAVCERNLHRPTSAYHRFQCDACGRAFPCGSALAIHRTACTAPPPYRHPPHPQEPADIPTDLTSHQRPAYTDAESEEEVEERKRDDFFAGLDLRNKSVPSSPPEMGQQRREEKFESALYFNAVGGSGKDLADIQSILSVTSGSGMLQELSSGSGAGEEEQQDCFAAEFRRMKQKGEFPCRLCTAVFPNLRALKGHNRAHLATGIGPFRCNMCAYSHGDKAVLVRHMRTHNGDRPYECALCNYAFTTKANCERHLRNRHSKLSRDEVKKSIIYHPSEDPTNEPDAIPSPVPPPVKRVLVFGQDDCRSSGDEPTQPPPARWDTQEVATMTNLRGDDCDEQGSGMTDLSADENTDNEDVLHHKRTNIETLVNFTKNNKNAFTKLSPATLEDQRLTSENSLRHVPMASSYIREVNSPLDLSMDALDLSKKRESTTSFTTTKDEDDDSVPQDLSIKSNTEFNNNTKKPSAFVAPIKSETPPKPMSLYGGSTGPTPKLDVAAAAFYASRHLSPLFLNNNGYSFHHAQAPFPVHPYFISAAAAATPPHPLFPPAANMQEIADMKERLQKELIRGLQLTSGGSLLDPLAAADRLQAYHQQALAEMARNKDIKQEVKESIPIIDKPVPKPLSSSPVSNNNNNNNNNNINNNNNNNSNKPIRDRDTPSAVKMVIKNGVLMPKQKQRRYRTERPFACEHCSARFTLRSNMERHVKQQHPQFWSQRQRGGSGTVPGGGVARRIHPPQILHEDKPAPPPVVTISPPEDDPRLEDEDNNNSSKTCISDEVRLAIAQQLKSKLCPTPERTERLDEEEEEDDGDLVIDEDKTVDEDAVIISTSDVSQHAVLAIPERKDEGAVDLASVSRLLDNASTQTQAFQQYFRSTQDAEDFGRGEGSEEDEEGLVAGSNSEGNNSGSDENRSESDTASGGKKKSAYSLAPNRVSCPYCLRKFPWSSSLRRHVLTHTGQKPYKCPHCPLLFTTKSNCDRHLLRKHGGNNNNNTSVNSSGNSTAGSSSETSPGSTAPVTTPATSNYTMRNVPERPYKCNHCPSSTFSTQSNLRKHVVTKHGSSSPTSPLPGAVGTGVSDCSTHSIGGGSHYGGDDSHGSGSEEPDVDRVPAAPYSEPGDVSEVPSPVPPRETHTTPPAAATIPTGTASELPFKCHLCEGGYAERQDALDHIREMHCAEFELLMSKGALESATEDNNNVHTATSTTTAGQEDGGGDESLEQLRGKFPDYANRKVMCAFCLRRFWSAEDLRRHMRTHTGERPFSCDICRRRFTLKHSMLRHRKKHTAGTAPADDASSAVSGDEEPPETPAPAPPAVNHNNNTIVAATAGTKHRLLLDGGTDEETDLIGNLLGIQDKSIIDKVLQSKSADDAAKLLGVKNGNH